MLRSIGKHAGKESGDNIYYDRLWEQLYFLKDGELMVQDLLSGDTTRLVAPCNRSSVYTGHYCTIPRLQVMSGQVILNMHRNVLSNSADSEASVRTDVEIVDGSQWEFHAPICLSKIKLGLCKIAEDGREEYCLLDFCATNPRTVSFIIKGNQLSALVNGRSPLPQHIQTITYDSQCNKWYPYARLEEKGSTLIFSPFSRMHANLNPFAGTQIPNIPPQPTSHTSAQSPIAERIIMLRQLCDDRMLLIWADGSGKVLHRDRSTNRFLLPMSEANDRLIWGLISSQEHNIMAYSSKEMFHFQTVYSIADIFHWVQYLLSTLSATEQQQAYMLLLEKLLLLRPYLKSLGLRIPNNVICSELDCNSQGIAKRYFPQSSVSYRVASSLLLNESSCTRIQGSLVSLTQNYLLSHAGSEYIIYHLGDTIQEVFRAALEADIFSKQTVVESYDEKDILALKCTEGPSIYKILASCLQKEKRSREKFMVNENYVRELVQDYRLTDAEARSALEQAGEIEEALLVWAMRTTKEVIGNDTSDRDQGVKSQCGTLLQTSNLPFTRLVLMISNQLYLIGIPPKATRSLIYKTEQNYVNLVDFKHQQTLAQLKTSQWYATWNHPKLQLQDKLTLSCLPELVSIDNMNLTIYTMVDGVSSHKRVTINADNIFDLQCCLAEDNQFEPCSQSRKLCNANLTVQGELVFQEHWDTRSFKTNTTVFINGCVCTNAIPNPDIHLAIQVDRRLVFDQYIQKEKAQKEKGQKEKGQKEKEEVKKEILPLMVSDGPPPCNLNSSISQILKPGGNFLGNYPNEIRLQHQHGKYIQVSMVSLEVNHRRRQANQVVSCSVYLANEQGVRSDSYSLKAEGDNKSLFSVSVFDRRHWKYLVIVPSFTNHKRMPFEFGFLSVHGDSVECDEGSRALQEKVQQSLLLKVGDETVPFQVLQASEQGGIVKVSVNIGKVDQKKLQVWVNGSLQTSRQLVFCKAKEKSEKSNRVCNLSALSSSEIVKAVQSKSAQRHELLESISASRMFRFEGFPETDIRKFIDLALYDVSRLKSQQLGQILKKLLGCELGKKYLLQLCDNLVYNQVTIPIEYLRLLMPRMSDAQHLNNVYALLARIKEMRSCKYQAFRKQKIPYLVLERQFYSVYYLNQIDQLEETAQHIYQQTLIPAETVVHRDELTRRIILRFDGLYEVDHLLLRFDRCDVSYKVHYHVHALSGDNRSLLAEGNILQYQCEQLSSNTYYEANNNAFGKQSQSLNGYGISLSVKTSYLSVDLNYSLTGILSHTDEAGNLQAEILPEAYGQAVEETNSCEPHVDFTFVKEQMFLLAKVERGGQPVEKFTICRNAGREYLYYRPQQQPISALLSRIEGNINKEEYVGLVALHKSYVKQCQPSNKVCLDYLYTLLLLTLDQLLTRQVKLEQRLCDSLFVQIISQEEGPIKQCSFRAVSHSVKHLMKSLQYLGDYTPAVGNIDFMEKNLYEAMDLNNVELCSALCRLIVRGVPYQNKWANLLIKVANIIDGHRQIADYILPHSEWLSSRLVVQYFAGLPEPTISAVFLSKVKPDDLAPFVMECHRCKVVAPIEMFLDRLIGYQGTVKIDLDIVSLMFEQSQIKWDNMYRVMQLCPEASDLIIHQFLQANSPQLLASKHSQLVAVAATNDKYSEQLAGFLTTLFNASRSCFKRTILEFPSNCMQLHEDLYDCLAIFLQQECHFGGSEGAKLLTEEELTNLNVAGEICRLMRRDTQGELPNEEIFIEWYLNNNSYTLLPSSPANRSPAMHLMRHLAELVLELLSRASIPKVMTVYETLKSKAKAMKNLPLCTKHLLANQLHNGVESLLARTVSPESLIEVLVGPAGILNNLIGELKESFICDAKGNRKWDGVKEIDCTDKFTVSLPMQETIKDMQANRSGNRSVLFKVASTQGIITLSSSQEQASLLNSFLIGFFANDANDKSTILPFSAELYGGSSTSTMQKMGELKRIDDQHFLAFGVRVFGINFNSLACRQAVRTAKVLQLRLQAPLLASVSDVLENNQRSRKGSLYSISFLCLTRYDRQPTCEPSYTKIYQTLLSFLGQQKYRGALREIRRTEQFDQKLQLIIQVLNNLLPDKRMEQLLLALNEEGENVLDQILKSKNANAKLLKALLGSNANRTNLSKLIAYTLLNMNEQYVAIVLESLRVASYAEPSKDANKAISDISSLANHLSHIEHSNGALKEQYSRLIATLLTVPNVCHYDVANLIAIIWAKPNRRLFYPLLSAIISYHQNEFKTLLQPKYFDQLVTDLTKSMSYNQTAQCIEDIAEELSLLASLASHPLGRDKLVSSNIPITLITLLRSEKTLLIKYPSATLKHLISIFQNTCVGSACAGRLSEIVIDMLLSLSQFDNNYHAFFINEFFFPLIFAYAGVTVGFVWKGVRHKQYLAQPTQVLELRPIRSTDAVILFAEEYYSPVETFEKETLAKTLLIRTKQGGKAYKWIGGKLLVADSQNKEVPFEVISKHRIQIAGENMDDYDTYELCDKEIELLTNQTLLNLKNPPLFDGKYRCKLPVQQSTYEHLYFLPKEMTIRDVLNHFSLCGFRIPEESAIVVKDYFAQSVIDHSKTLGELSQWQQLPIIKLEIEAHQVFVGSSIEQIVRDSNRSQTPFVCKQTFFKHFEANKGVQKLISVLKACVRNWKNEGQGKVWHQYLNELQSYSCFPVFNSLYMSQQSNVQLLFDLLSGLPDKEDTKKWTALQKESVKYLYDIVKKVFEVEGEETLKIRQYAIESGFYSTMLERLHLITKDVKRVKVDQKEQKEEQIKQQEVPMPGIARLSSEDEHQANLLKKKKGIGYGTDSSTNQKWDITGQQSARKELSEQILNLLNILEKFIGHKQFEIPVTFLEETFASSLLPSLQTSFRGGSLLEISKYVDLFQGELKFVRVLARSKVLVPALMSVPDCYEPRQSESISSLLKSLASTSKIFLSCLTGSATEKVSQEIAKDILETDTIIQGAIAEYQIGHNDDQEERRILELPLAKKYPLLMKDLRFDYIDMKDKGGKTIKHHYASSYQPNHKCPPQKTIRLAQELADVSHALPIDHTNAIFVRCDRERVDFMQALIMGSNGTPYGHGAYLFDIHFEDTYPAVPPKVNLTTTGNGQIRFNPNLYACGKVCLSLLGTWRGSAMENWDPKVSTLLQVLVSIQSIIMSEQIYFNEPGFEYEQGTVEGEKKNEAYANVVRYGNIKFAMVDNLKNPPKGFQSIIRRHFYLKKQEILEECAKWLKLADKRQASYTGLVSDHNNNWCSTFKNSKAEYKNYLEKAIKELEAELAKLPEPSAKDLIKEVKKEQKEVKKTEKLKEPKKQANYADLQSVDVTYDQKQFSHKELDVNDEKVKDRWSRYIGAMGIDAVSKQSKASVLMFGLGPVGVQIAKNIILSGCRQFTVCDEGRITWNDLSGQFFASQEDVGKDRISSCLYKLQELNHYVRVDSAKIDFAELSSLKNYTLVISTEQTTKQQIALDAYCRTHGIKFIIVDCNGPFGMVFNDFGSGFQVLDKNGEEAIEVMIEKITSAETGVVTLLKGIRNPYQDGEVIRIGEVQGMRKGEETINGSLHKIKVINQSSFTIGDTTGYTPYEGNGVARNIKIASQLHFKSYEETLDCWRIDPNLEYCDFLKAVNNRVLQKCFITLSVFREVYYRFPKAWDASDCYKFLEILKDKVGQLSAAQVRLAKLFSLTCSGTFGPICAFFGGLAAQEAFKAITGKYMPICQYFLVDFLEILPKIPQEETALEDFLKQMNYQSHEDRFQGIRSIVGDDLFSRIRNCKVFLIGSGAIGCQLLKNYAMINLGTGEGTAQTNQSKEQGKIIVTDPDHIETSNLNRQFLFREKHIRKSKSVVASAAVTQMNKHLKGHIWAKLDKVCEATKDIFSNQFFEQLTIVTNALDNVQARQYVDLRCLESKLPLLQSGTLSSKGHVQVIIPYKTETYGSKADPVEEGQIPHCTLKMFPEETLHCVEWARDIFGKTFILKPKALAKILESWEKFQPSSSDLQMLRDCVKMLQRRPSNFDDAVFVATRKFFKLFRNDIKQLLYMYPLDAKTKDGKPFWKLPKRPPTPTEDINPHNELHACFITSYAVLLCRVYKVPVPTDFRTSSKRLEIAAEAAKIKVEPFIPSDSLAKEMMKQVNNDSKEEKNVQTEIDGESQGTEVQGKQETELAKVQVNQQTGLFNTFKRMLQTAKAQGQDIQAVAEEFEKDDDQNGHIDLIYSMANLRAENYRLEKMDWLTTKLKAGRITPALSTTTSCIAGLQTIQLVKYLNDCPLEQMRNTFMNLAGPMFQFIQPGAVEQIRINDKLTTNIWERWEVGPVNPSEVNMRQFLQLIEDNYGIVLKAINLLEGGQIYSVFGEMENNKALKETFLQTTLTTVLLQEMAAQEIGKFVDMTLVFAVDEELAKHVPTLRVLLQP